VQVKKIVNWNVRHSGKAKNLGTIKTINNSALPFAKFSDIATKSFFLFMMLFPHNHPEYIGDACICYWKDKGQKVKRH
jgi:hypothetical protein